MHSSERRIGQGRRFAGPFGKMGTKGGNKWGKKIEMNDRIVFHFIQIQLPFI
jgi:hypothetical protein